MNLTMNPILNYGLYLMSPFRIYPYLMSPVQQIPPYPPIVFLKKLGQWFVASAVMPIGVIQSSSRPFIFLSPPSTALSKLARFPKPTRIIVLVALSQLVLRCSTNLLVWPQPVPITAAFHSPRWLRWLESIQDNGL